MDPLFLKYLRTAAEASWSGSVQVRDGELLCGHVIFVEGKVAWAVSKKQKEDLGSFLWRLGFVTKGQLDVVRSLYSAYEGNRRLGAILEQCGFLSPSALRRSLVLHTRAAIASLGDIEQARYAQVAGSLAEGEELVFTLKEVLPEREAVELAPTASEPTWHFWTARGSENEILSPLATITDYRAAVVCAADGSVLTAHVAANPVDPLRLGIVLGSLLDAARRDPPADDIGGLQFVCIGHAHGHLLARVTSAGFLVGVLIGPEGNAIEVQRALDDALPAVEAWSREYASPGRFRRLLKGLVHEADDDDATMDAVRIAVRERLRLARARREPAATIELFEKALGMIENDTLQGAISVIDELANGD